MRIYFIFFLLKIFNEVNGNLNIRRFYNKKNINSKEVKVYITFGIAHRIITRNKITTLEKVHTNYGKKDFINIMNNNNGKMNNENNINGFSYTYNLPNSNGSNNEPKSYTMSSEQFNIMYDYYSSIFSETAKDNDGNIKFKIKQIGDTTSSGYIESATYFSFINTLSNLNIWDKNSDSKRSSTILWINSIHRSLWKKGINNYSGGNLTMTNNNYPSEYIIIKEQKMQKEKYDKLSKVNTLMNSGTSKIHKCFILSLNPNVQEKKRFFFESLGKNYYLIDKELNYYTIEENDLDFNNNIPVIKTIKKIGRIKDFNALEKEYNDDATKVEENKTISYDEYLFSMDPNIFQGSNPKTNILTFLILNIQEDKNNPSIKSFQNLIERIHDNNRNPNNKSVYDFNRENIDSSLFFLFGYHGKLQEHSLPYDYYVKNVENFEENKNDKKKNLLQESDKYNIPSYTTKNENIILLNNALLTLPQTEPFHTTQLGTVISILLLQGNFSLLLSLEYMPIINNVSFNIPMRQMTNDLYFTVFLGYRILESVYIGPNITIMSAKYFLHKYLDISYGINITSTLFPIVITLYCSYDIANNTSSFNLNAQLATKVYGDDDFTEEEMNQSTYVEFL